MISKIGIWMRNAVFQKLAQSDRFNKDVNGWICLHLFITARNVNTNLTFNCFCSIIRTRIIVKVNLYLIHVLYKRHRINKGIE